MSEDWIEIPKSDNMPNKMKYHNGNLLFQYEEGTTTRVHEIERTAYEKLIDLIGSDDLRLRIEIINILSDRYTITQVGSKRDFSDNIDEKFNYECGQCNSEKKFQMMGQYRSPYAKCLCCGYEMTVTLLDCDRCNQRSVFISEHKVGSEQKCYKCHKPLSEVILS